jgi:hypothetical protein
LKPDTIGLIHTGAYTGNINYTNKAMMWLLYSEQTDGSCIHHVRNGRDQKLPELPYLSADGFCGETKTVYKFNGCYWHGHLCQQIRDVPTVAGEKLAEGYEKNHGSVGPDHRSKVPSRS